MKTILRKHPLAIRWFHWIHFPLLTIMIWSGLLIYWAYDPYHISVGSTRVFSFFPDAFYKALHIPYHLATGMSFHFAFMWLFLINGLLYVLYTALSGEWRYLLPNKHSYKEAWQVLLFDLHIRKTQPPQAKYNAAQRIAYTLIVVMGAGSLLTGLAIYKPVQMGWLTALFGGYQSARTVHFILTIGFVLFFVVHILQVIKAGWRNFAAMITGFEIIPNKIYPDVSASQTPQIETDETN